MEDISILVFGTTQVIARNVSLSKNAENYYLDRVIRYFVNKIYQRENSRLRNSIIFYTSTFLTLKRLKRIFLQQCLSWHGLSTV